MLPVIVLLVAASAVTGMLAQLGARIRTGHIFVLLAVVVSVGATVYTARPALDLQVEAVAFAIGAGALYGALPVLCRNAGRSPDIAAVAIYLSYGTLWAVAISVMLRGQSLGETAAIALSPEALIAGVFCTGFAYALFQVGLCPDRHGRRLGSTWAALLYGFEPVSAILVAGLFLGQAVSMAGLIFAGAFLMLVALAGPTLTQLTDAKA